MENNRRNRLEMIPSADALMSYVFRALQYLGGSGANKEIDSAVERILDLPDDVVSESHLGSFTQTELSYRVAWAKTKLKKKGIITNSARSVWSILPQFQQYTNLEDIAVSLLMDQEDAEAETAAEMKTEQDWLSNVSERLHSMDPYAFERLIQRLLRECGFSSVTVTRKSGDGGIDGFGELKVLGLFSFRVAFQCKRYRGAVGSAAIRDFRGALSSDIERALFITTGTFSKQAAEEASKEGKRHIDLIDGEELIQRMKEAGVGIKPVEAFEVDDSFF